MSDSGSSANGKKPAAAKRASAGSSQGAQQLSHTLTELRRRLQHLETRVAGFEQEARQRLDRVELEIPAQRDFGTRLDLLVDAKAPKGADELSKLRDFFGRLYPFDEDRECVSWQDGIEINDALVATWSDPKERGLYIGSGMLPYSFALCAWVPIAQVNGVSVCFPHTTEQRLGAPLLPALRESGSAVFFVQGNYDKAPGHIMLDVLAEAVFAVASGHPAVFLVVHNQLDACVYSNDQTTLSEPQITAPLFGSTTKSAASFSDRAIASECFQVVHILFSLYDEWLAEVLPTKLHGDLAHRILAGPTSIKKFTDLISRFHVVFKKGAFPLLDATRVSVPNYVLAKMFNAVSALRLHTPEADALARLAQAQLLSTIERTNWEGCFGTTSVVDGTVTLLANSAFVAKSKVEARKRGDSPRVLDLLAGPWQF